MAAGKASRLGHSVLILEKMPKIARKVRITGKGRCNLTNTKSWTEFENSIFPKPNFFKKAFFNFDNLKTIDLFEKTLSVPLKVERDKRVFPVSDKSSEIIKALDLWAKQAKIVCNCSVTSVEIIGDNINRIICSQDGKAVSYQAHNYLLATGGLSYPTTGSTGDGLSLAQSMGHTVNPCLPSLVPLISPDVKNLQGLALKNTTATLLKENKKMQEEFGELLFTHNGLSGPTILTLSRLAVILLQQNENTSISLDLKPSLAVEQLSQRISREISTAPDKQINTFLKNYLPLRLIPCIIDRLGVNPQSKISSLNITKKLALLLKNLNFTIVGHCGFEQAIITQGGIPTAEIDSKSMRSKLINNLYLSGEIIDLDAYTGGFNLQIAFSTGYLAGELKK